MAASGFQVLLSTITLSFSSYPSLASEELSIQGSVWSPWQGMSSAHRPHWGIPCWEVRCVETWWRIYGTSPSL